MTKLYANLHHHHHHHHHNPQVTFKVDQRATFKAESMSSLSDVSDVLPPPDDDVDTQLISRVYGADDVISRVYGAGRKPTTIALSFRPPRKQRSTHKLPRLVAKTTARRPSNVTSLAGDVTSLGDDKHVTEMVASKSMHSLSKTNQEVNRRRALQPATDRNGIQTISSISECHQAVTSSAKAKELGTTKALLSADWKPNSFSNRDGTRSNSVIKTCLVYTLIL